MGRRSIPEILQEKENLQDSPIACAVADAWASIQGQLSIDSPTPYGLLGRRLDVLEQVTRPSRLRKVHQ